MNGTSEKFSRSSRAFSNMSNFYGVASNMSAEYGVVVMSRQQRKAGVVIAVREDDITGGGGREWNHKHKRKIVCLISHTSRMVLALWPRIKKGLVGTVERERAE